MKMRRERDAKRVAKSIRTHEATMAAYGKATGWHSSEGVTGMSSRRGTYEVTRVSANPKTKKVFTPGAAYVAEKHGNAKTVDGERGISRTQYARNGRTQKQQKEHDQKIARRTPGEGHVSSTAEPSFEFNDKIYTQKKWFDESHWGSQGISKKKSFTPKKISKKKEDK